MKTYIEKRELIQREVMNNLLTVYADDKEIISGATDLLITLEVANPNQQFVDDLLGFMYWAKLTAQPKSKALTTILHDLGEFSRNRHENWFCPRSFGYAKYLTGASNIES